MFEMCYDRTETVISLILLWHFQGKADKETRDCRVLLWSLLRQNDKQYLCTYLNTSYLFPWHDPRETTFLCHPV